MSELKSYDLVDIQDYRGEVYLKSEADKVIAELKDKALQYKVLDKEHCRDLNTQERFFAKQIAYNKYKRCLANADAAMHKRWRNDEGFDYARSTRHMNKWLELAEKFKEVK